MSSAQLNPCLACAVGQQCCSRLSGLRLSKKEFENYFAEYSDQISAIRCHKSYLVSSLGGPCPHWHESGCRIYDDRPFDCRLYPYEITRVAEKGKSIEVIFHGNDGCPQRDQLLMPIEEAKGLIEGFCKTAYGQDKTIAMKCEVPRKSIFDPVLARFSRIFRACR